jgi:hypothetical protein
MMQVLSIVVCENILVEPFQQYMIGAVGLIGIGTLKWDSESRHVGEVFFICSSVSSKQVVAT